MQYKEVKYLKFLKSKHSINIYLLYFRNTKINDANIIPSHITTLNRFHLDLSNTQITDVSNIIQILN